MDILEEIVAHKKTELDEWKSMLSMRRLYEMTEPELLKPVASMSGALKASKTGIIAEFKRKSPSKGWIHKDAKAAVVPKSYQDNGASALSILTDREYFGGYDEFIQDARATGVTIPILYKNFVIDDYQLLQARHCGASAVLLIAACLTVEQCRHLMDNAHSLGLEVLLEMHSERDFDYAELGPDMYGINNRNLGTFITDVNNSFRLADRLPDDGVVKVSESGIGNVETIRQLREAGFNGFLMGEHFMKEPDPGKALADFISKI